MLLALPALLVLGLPLAASVLLLRPASPHLPDGVRRPRDVERVSRRWRRAGVAAGAAVALVAFASATAAPGPTGGGPLLAAQLLPLGLLAGVLAGELAVAPPLTPTCRP